jgi:hypothetical protein
LVPNNTPTPNPAIKSTYITGVDGSTALGWTANTTVATYNVAYQQIPANANLTQALVPPSTGTYITHYPSGIGYTGSPVDVTAVDFNSLTTGTAANRPQLLLTASKYGSPNGILSPPVVYSTGANYVYVVNNNALFRLDYSSAANFANPANVGYSLTRIGRGTNGTIDTVSVPNNFISNPTPPLLTDLGSVYALDLKAISPGIWSFSLNLFNGLAAPGAMYSATSYNMDSLAVSVPTYQSGTYACYDSWGTNVGNAYFGLGNGNIYMVSL